MIATDPRVPLLAAALHEIEWLHSPEDDCPIDSERAFAEGILAVLPEGAWPLPDDVRIPEGFMAVQASTIREKDATITALRAALVELGGQCVVAGPDFLDVLARANRVAQDTAAAAEQAKAAIEKALLDRLDKIGALIVPDGCTPDVYLSRALLDGGEK